MSFNHSLHQYLLRFADTNLILGQRLAGWCGHGPVLEEDIALTNIALDYVGQATALYKRAAELSDVKTNEDDLAFLRDECDYRNLLIAELPNGDYAFTIARQFVFSSWYKSVLEKLTASEDEWLRGFANKSLKEIKYHVQHSSDWVLRMGDGTTESHDRIQKALDEIWPFTGEFFEQDELDTQLFKQGSGVDFSELKSSWIKETQSIIHEATLVVPECNWFQTGGKSGRHSEYLGPLLAEMQFLPRAYPGANW